MKFLVCYLGMGNSLVLKQEFETKQEAVSYLEIANFNNSTLNGAFFFIIEAMMMKVPYLP